MKPLKKPPKKKQPKMAWNLHNLQESGTFSLALFLLLGPKMGDQASAVKFTLQTAGWRTERKKLHFLSSQRLHIILLFTSYWPEIICIIMLAIEDKNLYFILGSLQVAMFPVKNNGFYDVNI